MEVSGYFHIFKHKEDRELDDYNITKEVTQGQIRIHLMVDKPLLGEFDIQNTEKRQHDIVMKNLLKEHLENNLPKEEEETPLQKATRKALELRQKRRIDQDKQTEAKLRRVSRSPERRDMVEQENTDSNSVNQSLSELKVRHNQHLKELHDLTMKLKGTLIEERDDEVLGDEDDFMRATNQNLGEEE